MQIDIAPEIKDALKSGKGVVALESTIITHGFPYPENLSVAAEMEDAVRNQDAVPATIAIIDGQMKCGLAASDLERLAKKDKVKKCSIRDLPFVVARGGLGATTVASTAYIARAAGIKVFATGGIGGVHPAEEGAGGYDVSADLLELSRTKIVVVSAGAKSILDLPATLEVLETYSVPVVGYQTKEFPAFHSRESGLFLSHMAQDLDELSELVRAHFNLDLLSAFLVCNPVPEHAAMEPAEIKTLIEAARQEAIVDGIKGPAMTPYILAAINRLSHGKTSDVNKALGLNNAVLAARLASRLV